MALAPSQTLQGDWLPTEKIKLALAYDLSLAHEILRLQISALLLSAMDRETGTLSAGKLEARQPRVQEHLQEIRRDVRASFQWALEQIVLVDLARGMDAHDRWFRPPVTESYQALRRQLVGWAWAQSGAKLEQRVDRLSRMLWREDRLRKCIMARIFAESAGGTSAWQAAKALEQMLGVPTQGPRWLYHRLYHMTPEGRKRDRTGLVTTDLARAEARKGVHRGVSYRALRIARTEISRTHHHNNLNLYRIQPWVVGVRWRLSPGHPQNDICDTYAARGLYQVNAVPELPHPQCMCYLTPEVLPRGDFDRRVAQWVRGRNRFLDDYQKFLGFSPLRASATPARFRGRYRDAQKAWMDQKPHLRAETKAKMQQYRNLLWIDRKLGLLQRVQKQGHQPDIDRALAAQADDASLQGASRLQTVPIDARTRALMTYAAGCLRQGR